MKRLLIASVASLALLAQALATTTPNSIITAQTPNRGVVQFLQGTDTAGVYKTLYTAGANGSKCFGIWETNNDLSATHVVTVQVSSSTSAHCSPATSCYGGAALTSGEGDGFVTGIPAKNMMSSANWPGLPLDGNSNPFVYLKSGDTLEATFATALTSTDWINFTSVCVDF
jgi:hypothetical protein